MPTTIIIVSKLRPLYQITAKDGGPLVMTPLTPNDGNPENPPYNFFDVDTCWVIVKCESPPEVYTVGKKFVKAIPPRQKTSIIKDIGMKSLRVDPKVVTEALGAEPVDPDTFAYFNPRRLKKSKDLK